MHFKQSLLDSIYAIECPLVSVVVRKHLGYHEAVLEHNLFSKGKLLALVFCFLKIESIWMVLNDW